MKPISFSKAPKPLSMQTPSLSKVFGLLLILIIALIYALPNFYGEDPAIQITGTRGQAADSNTISIVQKTLAENHIAIKSIVLTDGFVLVRFSDVQTQLAGRELLMAALAEKYVIALNLAPATPNWLAALGAGPVKLGLDLQGGIHFLMEVDLATAFTKAQEQNSVLINTALREQSMTPITISHGKNYNILINFMDEKSRDDAVAYLKPRYPDFSFSFEGKGQLTVAINEAGLHRIQENVMDQNMTILRNRVNKLGVAEPLVQRQSTNQILVQLPGIQDNARAKDILGVTETVEFRAVNTTVKASQQRLPYDSEIKRTRAGEQIVLYKRAVLSGNHITYASSGIDPSSNRYKVDITLDKAGGEIMSNFTQNSIGQPMATLFTEYKDSGKKDENGKPILMRYDEIINIATIQQRLNNRFQISPMSNKEEAHQLAMLLRAGALFAPVTIVEERTIGPALGAQNISLGLQACVWALLSSIAFMLFYYRRFGFIASGALLANLIFIVAVMSLLPGATLTMPGIAGIVLTLAVAVDANVLINERIKEELNQGRSIRLAIREGYSGAFSSIIDANVTTLITAVMLYAIGSGSIKGFAITTIIGLMTSIFTAVVGTRIIVERIYSNRNIKKISI